MRERSLTIRDLTISFRTGAGAVRAVRGVDLDLYRGETLAIVGESGSGKSVTVKAVMGISSSNQTVESGSILYYSGGEERDLLKLSRREMRRQINGTHISMVFQDPMTSLDPTMTIGTQLMEGMRHHLRYTKAQARARAVELLELVGITDAPKRMKNYPHQLSGGMRQRVVIAIALSCGPDILICDEPTTALDVMYAGRIVEKGTAEDIFYDPRHPYTWGLLSSMPDLSARGDEPLYTIPGSPPNMVDLPEGDPFAPRNRFALEADFKAEPPEYQIGPAHYAATWLLDGRAPRVDLPEPLRRRIEAMRQGGGRRG